MLHRSLLALLALATLLVAPTCSGAEPAARGDLAPADMAPADLAPADLAPADPAQDEIGQGYAGLVRRAIERSNADWMDSFRRGDRQGLARPFAAQASLTPPFSRPIEGRRHIAAWFLDQRTEGMREPALSTLDVHVLAQGLAYEVGTYRIVYEFGVDAGGVDSGRYFAIWRREEPDGWRCHVSIWNGTEINRSLRHHAPAVTGLGESGPRARFPYRRRGGDRGR